MTDETIAIIKNDEKLVKLLSLIWKESILQEIYDKPPEIKMHRVGIDKYDLEQIGFLSLWQGSPKIHPDKHIEYLAKNNICRILGGLPRNAQSKISGIYEPVHSLIYQDDCIIRDYKYGQDSTPEWSSVSDIVIFEYDKNYLQEIINKLNNKITENRESRVLDFNNITSQKTTFDSQNGVLRFGNDTYHKFHRGNSGSTLRLSLFRKLWDNRKFIRDGKIKNIGKALPPEMLAVQLDLINDSKKYKNNRKIEKQFSEIIKGINRILKDKNFPVKIERKNGILLIVNEIK